MAGCSSKKEKEHFQYNMNDPLYIIVLILAIIVGVFVVLPILAKLLKKILRGKRSRKRIY